MKAADVAAYIDHTLLKPDATPDQVAELCTQARDYKFASVCVNPCNIRQCAEALAGSGAMVCTVVGFPLGSMTTAAKAAETRDAVALGAEEIDMVINVGRLKARDYHYVLCDIQAVVDAAGGRTVKVIIETSLLTEEEKVAASLLTKAGGAHFVKTSTGFSGGGATPEDISLMRQTVGDDFGVKASGGVRDLAAARKLLSAGANRLGCSASIAIVSGGKGKDGY
ncbi:MAG: deoxyribose-phosphate aldolase [Candidatus Sumerlaeia bacterium]|nr:deoxyribose-phosphate aldolase [Candidatus Sumerlaeia bacterium]